MYAVKPLKVDLIISAVVIQKTLLQIWQQQLQDPKQNTIVMAQIKKRFDKGFTSINNFCNVQPVSKKCAQQTEIFLQHFKHWKTRASKFGRTN